MENSEIGRRDILLGISAFSLLYYIWLLFQDIYITKDGALYLLLAQSLASGGGYVDNFLLNPLPHTSYPPGYPFILSLIIKTVGYDILALRAINVIFAVISLYVLAKILGRYLKTWELAIVFCLFAFNPLFVSLTNSINSDIPHLLFLSLSFLIFANGKNSLPLSKFLTWVFIIIAAFYMRMAGLALYLAALIYLAFQRMRKKFFLLLIFGFFILFWCGMTFLEPSGFYRHVFLAKNIHLPTSDTIGFIDIPFRILSNLRYYSGKVIIDLVLHPFITEVTFGNPLFPLKICLSLSFSSLLLAGFILSARKKMCFIDLYVMVYIFMIMLWSYHGERFLIPIYPFLLGYMIVVLRAPKLKYFKLLIISILMCSVILANMKIVGNILSDAESPKKSLFEAYAWIKNNTPPGSLIMSDDPSSMYLYSQRKAALQCAARDTDLFFDMVKKGKVDYILIGRITMITVRGKKMDQFETYLKPVIEKYPGHFELVYLSSTKPEIMVWKVSL